MNNQQGTLSWTTLSLIGGHGGEESRTKGQDADGSTALGGRPVLRLRRSGGKQSAFTCFHTKKPEPRT